MTAESKDERQNAIKSVVSSYQLSSQSELVHALAHLGVNTTQTTVSRDLDQLGILKARGADGTVFYVLPESDGLGALLRRFVINIEASGNLAVVFTPPGAAGVVAQAIDATSIEQVLATLQGDDTILVVAREPATGQDVAKALQRLKAPELSPELQRPSVTEQRIMGLAASPDTHPSKENM